MPSRPVFPLDSAQCELLIAFEEASSLGDLAQAVGREASVVSRQLQRLAETAPVLEKRQGRWRLTELGRQFARWARSAVAEQVSMLRQHGALRLGDVALPEWLESAALVLVGVQQGFDDPAWGRRNNPRAEERIRGLLEAWRRAGRPVVHVRHESRFPQSPLRADAPGCAFKDFAAPAAGEILVAKSTNGAFTHTDLAAKLQSVGAGTLVLAGFTTNHCVDATARQASELGLRVFIVSDATVAFDRVGPDGRLLAAEDIHSVALASLHQEFGVVVSAGELLTPPRDIE